MVGTLHSLSKLRESRFGQPPPRHGLSLLWWFANRCIQIDSNGRLIALCKPKNGDFGFSFFHNLDGLLPNRPANSPYYKVGNLNHGDSPKLPGYVTENYKGYSADRNTDRIIVSLSSLWISPNEWQNLFDDIYITQHSDQANFDHNRTYRISKNLIKEIQNLTLEKFLRRMKNDQNHFNYKEQCYTNAQVSSSTQSMQAKSIYNPAYVQQSSYLSEDCIMSIFIVLLFTIVLLFLGFLSMNHKY